MSEEKLNNPVVSVVMPVFNHSEAQLTAAIDSILNQTFKNLELIIADGRKDDKNLKIISSINDTRIRYFKTCGYINNLNFGIEQARGKYIARMDSDDISYPTRIEEQVRFLDNNPEVSLCSCLVEYFGEGALLKFSGHTVEVNDLFNMISRCEFVHTAMMFRKNINIRYDDIKPMEDCLLFRKLLLAGHKFGIIDKILLKSYISNNSIVARHQNLTQNYLSMINIYSLSEYYDKKLSFADEIFSKKSFSKEEVVDFLSFIAELKDDLAKHNLDIYDIAYPYFLYIISRLKHKSFLLTTKIFYQTYFKYCVRRFAKKAARNIFSVSNEYEKIDENRVKQKVLCIFGQKVKLFVFKK